MAIPVLLASLSKTLLDRIPEVIQTVASRHDIQDPQTFSQDLLAGLGLATPPASPAPPAHKPAPPAPPDHKPAPPAPPAKKPKRVVSGAMKAKYLALPGATEDRLAKTINAYKEATEVTDWITFATSHLNQSSPPAPLAKDGPEEEDLQTIVHEEETLLINRATGMIYVETLEAGTVPIGRAGKGRFAHITLPN